MTGMEHAIERAARALYAYREVVGDFPDGTTDWDDLPEPWREEWREAGEHVVRALAEAGLLAPAPLREEWATRFPNGHLRPGKDRDYDLWWMGDPPKGVNVRRYVSDWMPADPAEGDGRADL